MKSIAFIFVAALLVLVAGHAEQHGDPNAIAKCTAGVSMTFGSAAMNPAAQACARRRHQKLKQGPQVCCDKRWFDSRQIDQSKVCKTWFLGLVVTVQKGTPCDFGDPTTGTVGKPSTSNTAKFKWTLPQFLQKASLVGTTSSNKLSFIARLLCMIMPESYLNWTRLSKAVASISSGSVGC
ncbi:Aste57867_14145 [Aphanomyces stellatus]|uniref:Aste57867_14145 protein n=1 Tax=Aphanomyces stellatus TaxID=120398 RepID=A0A485L1K6_9STRA|nr:hypothetical protein As57867_014094 [Aphanomyces stellatus]VFT90971.1 Aste57867_14145 [Aphanomyces stellatus]